MIFLIIFINNNLQNTKKGSEAILCASLQIREYNRRSGDTLKAGKEMISRRDRDVMSRSQDNKIVLTIFGPFHLAPQILC